MKVCREACFFPFVNVFFFVLIILAEFVSATLIKEEEPKKPLNLLANKYPVEDEQPRQNKISPLDYFHHKMLIIEQNMQDHDKVLASLFRLDQVSSNLDVGLEMFMNGKYYAIIRNLMQSQNPLIRMEIGVVLSAGLLHNDRAIELAFSNNFFSLCISLIKGEKENKVLQRFISILRSLCAGKRESVNRFLDEFAILFDDAFVKKLNTTQLVSEASILLRRIMIDASVNFKEILRQREQELENVSRIFCHLCDYMIENCLVESPFCDSFILQSDDAFDAFYQNRSIPAALRSLRMKFHDFRSKRYFDL